MISNDEMRVAAGIGDTRRVRSLLTKEELDICKNDRLKALHLAASSGHTQVIEELLKHGVDVDIADSKGGNALHRGASGGHVEVVKKLLQHGADVHRMDTHGGNALHCAAFHGHAEILRELLKHGANVHISNCKGWNVLHLSAQKGHAEVVKELLNHGADVHSADTNFGNALHRAAVKGHVAVVNNLLKHGANVHSTDRSGCNALHYAAVGGNIHVLQSLLRHGADLHSIDNNSRSALHFASKNGRLEFVKQLLYHGADVHSKDSEGAQVLHRAASKGHAQVAKELLEHGANVHGTQKNGWTPLHCAAYYGYEEIVRHLLESGAKIHSVENQGCPPLLFAAKKGHSEVTKYLLQHGSNIHCADKKGFNALHLAAMGGYMDAAVVLLHAGARLDKQSRSGNTPLHLAASRNQISMAEMLWYAGADPFKRNRLLRTARSYLKKEGLDLYNRMQTGRVEDPKIPSFPRNPNSPSHPLTPLEDALQSVLEGSSRASEHCRTLIRKENCSRSLPEWMAAHSLLVLAVSDGDVRPLQDDDSLYFWRDQLYCAASNISITNEKDKIAVFRSLRRAQELNIIHSADAYIQGIHIMQTVNSELSVVKKANMKLLQRVMALEFSLKDLRDAFSTYRRQQLICNLCGIALKLIPIAGGITAHAILVGAEVCGELKGADVIEYAFSMASGILQDEKFYKLPQATQTQLTTVFRDYGYSKEELRGLFSERENPANDKKSSFHQDKISGASIPANNTQTDFPSDVLDDISFENNVYDAKRQYSSPPDHIILDLEDSHFSFEKSADNSKVHGNTSLCTRHRTNMDLAREWAQFILGPVDSRDELLPSQVSNRLTNFIHQEKLCPLTFGTGSKQCINRLMDVSSEAVKSYVGDEKWKIGYSFRLSQFVQQYAEINFGDTLCASDEGGTSIIEFVEEWIQFIFSSMEDELELQVGMKNCLIRFLENEDISPQCIPFGTSKNIEELARSAEEVIKNEFGAQVKIGYQAKLILFLDQF